jgi:hypothetical protein
MAPTPPTSTSLSVDLMKHRVTKKRAEKITMPTQHFMISMTF